MEPERVMRTAFTALLLALTALALNGCMGYEKGNGLSRFDSKSFWESDGDEEGSGTSDTSSSVSHDSGSSN